MFILQLKKQCNKDWNSPIHLENSGQSIKVSLIFWFLIMTFNLWLYHQLGLNRYVYILEIDLHILENLIYYSQNVFECLTLNELHIDWASLTIYSINYNLANTSSTPPHEVNKKVLS